MRDILNVVNNNFYSFFDEIEQIHPTTSNFYHLFREDFAGFLPNVLKLAEGKLPLAKKYTDARQNELAEYLPGSDSHLSNKPDNRSAVLLHFTLEKVCDLEVYFYAFQ